MLKVYKFSSIQEMQAFLQGAVFGGREIAGTSIYLHGKSLTLASPVTGTVTFNAGVGATAQIPMSFQLIKSQIEAAFAGVKVLIMNKRLMLIEETPNSGVEVAAVDSANASIVGTVDMNTLAYGAGGDLDTLVFDYTVDGGGGSSVTFAAPVNAGDAVSQINAVTPGVASLDGDGHLVIRSSTMGSGSSIDIGSGTANSVLGMTDSASDTGSDDSANGLLGFGEDGAVGKVYGVDTGTPPAIHSFNAAPDGGGYTLVTEE